MQLPILSWINGNPYDPSNLAWWTEKNHTNKIGILPMMGYKEISCQVMLFNIFASI